MSLGLRQGGWGAGLTGGWVSRGTCMDPRQKLSYLFPGLPFLECRPQTCKDTERSGTVDRERV